MYKKLNLILFLLVITFFFNGCKKTVNHSDNVFTDFSDLSDKRIGVYTGTVHDAFLESNYPDVSIHRYDSTSDMVLSLRTENIDAALLDLTSARVLMKSAPGISILTDDILTLPLGVGFSKKKPDLKEKFNTFLQKLKESGVFEEMYTRWFIEDPLKAEMPDIRYTGTGPKVRVGVAVGDLPYVAYVNNEYVGFDIEMLKRFADHENLNLQFITMDFSALVMSLASGRVDIIADGISITDERQRHVDFSDSYLDFKTAVIVMDHNISKPSEVREKIVLPGTSIISKFKKSFYSNLIHEKRYKLILEGLKTTLVISFFATLFGTLFGAFICFLRMSKLSVSRKIAKTFISVIRGTPVLVLLMIIFYVVFASVNINPILVAVLAFGLNFAAYTSEMFRTGIESIDKGQTEAGIAMGFTKVSTFIYIILPQALRRIIPVYQGEIVSLTKMTSIVGYIAVQDLTKASDIIRSRTFDAFFPLLMVAFIYFLICWAVMAGMDFFDRKTNRKLSLRKR